MHLRGMIFDLDGTLADTLPVCIDAFQETVQYFTGRRPEPGEITALFGPNEEGMLETLIPGHLDQTLPRFVAEYERAHGQCRQLFPGVERALDLLKQGGIRMAIVSGKGRQSAEVSLRYLGLQRWIDCVETGFADKADKPASIRKVLAHWDMPPEQAAYVGDVPSDLQSARQAGVLPVGAAWAATSTLRDMPTLTSELIFYEINDFIQWIRSILE
jgi:pyrophosphatase PpaX